MVNVKSVLEEAAVSLHPKYGDVDNVLHAMGHPMPTTSFGSCVMLMD